MSEIFNTAFIVYTLKNHEWNPHSIHVNEGAAHIEAFYAMNRGAEKAEVYSPEILNLSPITADVAKLQNSVKIDSTYSVKRTHWILSHNVVVLDVYPTSTGLECIIKTTHPFEKSTLIWVWRDFQQAQNCAQEILKENS